ncbi:hypothetical protein ACW9IB_09500 [Pseudomonas sp. SDO524_S393]
MSRVNSQPAVSYQPGYQTPPTAAPVPHNEAVRSDENTGRARANVTTQQRKALGTQGRIESAPTQGQSAVIDQLRNDNKALRGQLKQVVDEFTSIISGLQQQITQLQQQLGAKNSPASAAPQLQAQAPAQASVGATASNGLQELAEENKQLRMTVNDLTAQFNAVVQQLQQQIGELKQKLAGQEAPESPSTSSPQPASVETAAASTSAQDVGTPSSVENLKRENEALRADIQKMIEHFKVVIKELQSQIVELNQQSSTPGA